MRFVDRRIFVYEEVFRSAKCCYCCCCCCCFFLPPTFILSYCVELSLAHSLTSAHKLPYLQIASSRVKKQAIFIALSNVKSFNKISFASHVLVGVIVVHFFPSSTCTDSVAFLFFFCSTEGERFTFRRAMFYANRITERIMITDIHKHAERKKGRKKKIVGDVKTPNTKTSTHGILCSCVYSASRR